MPKKYKLPRPYTALGDYLKQHRERAGLTQREVSLALDYTSAQFISNFERGLAAPPLKKLGVLTKLYRMPVDKTVDLQIQCERELILQALKGVA